MLEAMKGFKERYTIEIQQVGFDQDHVHILNLIGILNSNYISSMRKICINV